MVHSMRLSIVVILLCLFSSIGFGQSFEKAIVFSETGYYPTQPSTVEMTTGSAAVSWLKTDKILLDGVDLDSGHGLVLSGKLGL